MDPTTPPLLLAQGLCIGYKKGTKQETKVAGPLHLKIFPGQMICLLGPNGAGKSTLIRTLAGLQPLLAGDVQIAGESVAGMKPADLALKLSMVLTDRIRTGNLTVQALVALGRYPYTGWLGTLGAEDKRIVRWAIAATKIEPFLHRKLDQLSDGENQKVMLARALAQDTPLIILDEPTAHLDLPNRIELMRLLHQLARLTKKAILLTTHELDLALQAGDQVWLLQAGGQLKQGVPEDLVLDGSFEQAFDKAGFQFDKATGTFSIHQPQGPGIFLNGQGPAFFWTQRALRREGYGLVGQEAAETVVEITGQDQHLRWISKRLGHYTEHRTVADLLTFLRTRNSQSNSVNHTLSRS